MAILITSEQHEVLIAMGLDNDEFVIIDELPMYVGINFGLPARPESYNCDIQKEKPPRHRKVKGRRY